MSIAYAAVWFFVFSLPWENFIVIPGVGVFSRVIGAAGVGLTVVAMVLTGRFRRWQPFQYAAFLFVLWAAAVLLIAYNPAQMPKKFWTFVQLFVMVWMIWEIAVSRSRLIGLLSAYVLGAYVSALDTILLFRREGGAMKRFAAAGGDPNDLAMTLAAGIPMAWYLGMTYHRASVRWACRAYIPVGLLAIALTGSRGGMIASLVGLLIVPLTMTRLSPGKLALAIALLAISGGIAVAYVPKTIVSRLSTTTTAVEDLSLGGRFRIWKAGFHAFEQRPLIGYGSGAFKVALLPELGNATQVAHNSYLSVLVEEGLIGLLLYLSMFVAVFLALMRLRGLERRFALVLLATIAVAMLPLTWDDRKTVWFVLAALAGLARATTMAWRPAASGPEHAAPLYRGPASGRPASIAVPNARRGTSR